MKNFKKTARQTTGNGNALNAEGLFSLERELDDLTPAEQEGFSQKMTAEEAARIARVLLTERDNSLLTPAYNILERVTARNIDLVSAILPVALEGVRLRKEDGEKAGYGRRRGAMRLLMLCAEKGTEKQAEAAFAEALIGLGDPHWIVREASLETVTAAVERKAELTGDVELANDAALLPKILDAITRPMEGIFAEGVVSDVLDTVLGLRLERGSRGESEIKALQTAREKLPTGSSVAEELDGFIGSIEAVRVLRAAGQSRVLSPTR